MPLAAVALAAALQAMLDAPALAGAHVGVTVTAADDGRLLYGHDADSAYVPASTLKLLTAATALSVLGPNFRPRTTLVMDGTTLYLVGGGDPLLGEHDLGDAAAAVKAADISEVPRLAVDQSDFDGPAYPDGWLWDDLAAYYAPPITALSVEENALDVDIQPGARVGAPALVHVEEAHGDDLYENDATTAAANVTSTADCTLVPGGGAIRVTGAVPLGGGIVQQGCAVLDPTSFAATVLAGALAAHGVHVQAIVGEAAAPPAARELWRHDGPSVAELLPKMLPPSDNFIAEVLCRQIAKRVDATAAFSSCAREEVAYAQSVGIDPRTLSLHDGSGLSRYDLITPRDLAGVLSALWQGPYAQLVRSSLARPGQDGTLANRFSGSPIVARVFAKTGSMTHVDAIAGYVESRDRGMLAFAVLVNGFMHEKDRQTVRRAEERIVEAAAAL